MMDTNTQLAVITALEKWCKERAKEIRAQADGEFADQYDAYGTERMGLRINGQKVGDFILTFNAEHFAVTDKEAFEEWALDYGFAHIKKTIRPLMVGNVIALLEREVEPENIRDYIMEEVVVTNDWQDMMVSAGGKVLHAESGMEVPGVSFIPRSVKGTQVRGCKPENVVPLLQALPGGINSLLLGGE